MLKSVFKNVTTSAPTHNYWRNSILSRLGLVEPVEHALEVLPLGIDRLLQLMVQLRIEGRSN
jgi:hypothetical protein